MTQGIVRQGSEEWYKYLGILDDIDISAIEAQKSIQSLTDAAANVPLTKLKYELTTLQQGQQITQSLIDLRNAQGTKGVASDFTSLISNGSTVIKNLSSQNTLLQKQLKTLDPLSDKYQEIQSQIYENENAIWDMATAQEGWNDAILDLEIAKLQEHKEELQKQNSAYQRQLDLQDKIEAVEKARQRTRMVYREGVGFVREMDEKALVDAQKNLDQAMHDETLAKMDDQISAIEELKKTTNLYNAQAGVDGLWNSVLAGGFGGSIMENVMNKIGAIQSQVATSSAYQPIQFSISELNLNNVNDADALAKEIASVFAPKLQQELSKYL